MSLIFATAAAVAVATAPSPSAITSYPAAFFAASQPNSALDMVMLLPGFTFDGGANVRGFVGAAGNVLVDGARPASKDDAIDQILKRIPASSVDRIEVIRGGAPGIDMQGKTVLANVIRKKDGGLKVTTSLALDHAWDGRLAPGLRLEGEDRLGATSVEGSILIGRFVDDGAGSGPRTLTDGAGDVLERAFEDTSGGGDIYKGTGAVETPVMGGKLRVHASLTSQIYNYAQDDAFTDPTGREDERDHQGQTTAEVGLNYDHALGAKASVETYLLQQLGWSDFTANFTSDPVTANITGNPLSEYFSLAKQTGESIARITLKYQHSARLAFETGGEGDFNWLRDTTFETEDGAPTPVPAADVFVTELRGEVFGQATWQALHALTLEGGMRVEASKIASTGDTVDDRSFIYPKPRFVVTWSADPSDQLRLRVEREVGQLNFDDFAASAAPISNGGVHPGNPDISPQWDWVIEGAYDRRFWGAGDITITARHYQLHDVIDRVPVYVAGDPADDYDQPGNIGPGTNDEVALALTLPLDKLGIEHGLITGQGTRRWSRVIDPTTGLPRPISAEHPLDGELHFTQGLTRWKSTWGFDVYNQWRETRYYYDEVQIDKLKTFVTLFAEYKPKPDLSFRLEISNLTARGFEHALEVFNGPRNVYGLDYNDLRDLRTGRLLHFRIRKTFG
jgi:hypothetical protein